MDTICTGVTHDLHGRYTRFARALHTFTVLLLVKEKERKKDAARMQPYLG